MKKPASLFFVFVIMMVLPAFAQEPIGFNLSRWGGVLAVAQNPANAFSFDLKFDIHLSSVLLAAENNYLVLHSSKISSNADNRDILKPTPNGTNLSALISGEITGPSFLIRFSAKDALAFSTKDRVLVNIDDIPLDAANMLYDATLGSGANDYSFAGDYMSVNANNWLEYAFTYGRLLVDRGAHRLKGGITFKLLQGVGSYALTVRNFQSKLEIAQNIVDRVTADITYGHTQNLTWGNENNGLLKSEATGIGWDIGAVYEYCPSSSSAEKTGATGPSPAGDYKFKVGFALLDLGAITYQKKLGSHDFNVDVDVLDIVVFDTIESQADINDVLNGIQGVNPRVDDPGKFTMDLPARINAFIDYQVMKGFYINVNPVIALSGGKNDPYRTHQQTMCYFSLRFEKPWLGIYLPGAIGGLGGFRLGLGVKLGPLLVGSTSLLGLLFTGQTRSADVFVGVRIPLT